jgi:cytoskeletal protein RodZ
MLTAYARFLDLDAESLLLRFADALQAERLERHPFLGRRTRPREASTPVAMWFGRLFSTDLILGGGLVLAMVVFSVWGGARVISLRAEKQAELNISQSISEELLQSTVVAPAAAGTPTVAETALVEAPTSTPELPPVSNAPVSVTIIVTGRTWMRVTVDGEIVLEERVSAGSVFTYDADEQVEVLAADGGRVQIIYNDEKLGAMSIPGQVANMVYSTSGALVPTPTATPVPSATPRPTRTPVPSPTPRPTRTPRPTATQS